MWQLLLVVILILPLIAWVEHKYHHPHKGFVSYAALTNWERVLLSHQTIQLFQNGEYEVVSEVDTLSDALEFEAYMYLQGSWTDKQDYLAQAHHLFTYGAY